MTRRLTQRDRVLAALRRAGRHGLTQVDFHAPDVVDHGAPITRLSPRIRELRELGHKIDVRRERKGLARYVLVTSPADSGPAVDVGRVDVGRVVDELDLPAPAAGSPFDPFSEWA